MAQRRERADGSFEQAVALVVARLGGVVLARLRQYDDGWRNERTGEPVP